jgi:hypothetical protein
MNCTAGARIRQTEWGNEHLLLPAAMADTIGSPCLHHYTRKHLCHVCLVKVCVRCNTARAVHRAGSRNVWWNHSSVNWPFFFSNYSHVLIISIFGTFHVTILIIQTVLVYSKSIKWMYILLIISPITDKIRSFNIPLLFVTIPWNHIFHIYSWMRI